MEIQPPVKRVFPFGFPNTPFDPSKGKHYSLSNDKQFYVLNILYIYSDVLLCLDLQNQLAIIAKPYLLRRSPFDGETVDGITYTYDTSVAGKRSATDGVDTESHLITPDYVVGEEIVAIRNDANVYLYADTDGQPANAPAKARYIDMNTGGRCWAVEDV